MKKFLLARKDSRQGKLGTNWEGPYVIERIIRPRNYELQTEEVKVFAHSWNAD